MADNVKKENVLQEKSDIEASYAEKIIDVLPDEKKAATDDLFKQAKEALDNMLENISRKNKNMPDKDTGISAFFGRHGIFGFFRQKERTNAEGELKNAESIKPRIAYYDENGKLWMETYCKKDGTKEADAYYDENGKLKYLTTYRENGEKDKDIYVDKDGGIMTAAKYGKNDKPDMQVMYNKEGLPEKTFMYAYKEDGDLESISAYGRNGKLEKIRFYKDHEIECEINFNKDDAEDKEDAEKKEDKASEKGNSAAGGTDKGTSGGISAASEGKKEKEADINLEEPHEDEEKITVINIVVPDKEKKPEEKEPETGLQKEEKAPEIKEEKNTEEEKKDAPSEKKDDIPENGRKDITRRKDGSIEKEAYYRKDGSLYKERYYNKDESLSHEVYYRENGTQKYTTVEKPDGTKSEYHYRENGDLESVYKYRKDENLQSEDKYRMVSEAHYNEKTRQKESETYYRENGSIERTSWFDGKDNREDTCFDEKGRKDRIEYYRRRIRFRILFFSYGLDGRLAGTREVFEDSRDIPELVKDKNGQMLIPGEKTAASKNITAAKDKVPKPVIIGKGKNAGLNKEDILKVSSAGKPSAAAIKGNKGKEAPDTAVRTK